MDGSPERHFFGVGGCMNFYTCAILEVLHECDDHVEANFLHTQTVACNRASR